MDYFVLAIPFFLFLMVVEMIYAAVRGRELYRFPDTVNNLSCGIGQEVGQIFLKALTLLGYVYVYEHWALFKIEPGVLSWLAILVGVDFFYYWFHRASHRIAFLWASHVVHHQSEEYNLSVALRQSAFGGFFNWVFYLPLAFLGFPPEMFALSYAVNLLYQFWIHTRAIRTLGPLEWPLNSPSHHRVHHGRNPKYLDKNYAGIFMFWDRWFGTFEKEAEEPTYGIVKPLRSWNPLWANVHYWVELAQKLRETGNPAYLWRPPGWEPGMEKGALPEVDLLSPKYDARRKTWGNRYIASQFVLLVAVSAPYFFLSAKMDPAGRALVGLFIVLSLISLGALFESKRWALRFEGLRWSALLAGWIALRYAK